MNKFLLLCVLFIAFGANATNLTPSSVVYIEKSYLCDSNFAYQSSCEQLSADYFLNLVKTLTTTQNEECRLNPNEPTCGQVAEQPAQADFVVYYASTSRVKKWRVKKNVFSKKAQFSISEVTPTAIEVNNAASIAQASELYKEINDSYQFIENNDGQIINRKGQLISELVANNEQPIDNMGNCHSSLDYYNNTRMDNSLSGCTSFLNNWLNSQLVASDGLFDRFKKSIDSIQISIKPLSVTMKKNQNFEFNIKFNNNSKLVIQIDTSLTTPKITFDPDRSTLSSGLPLKMILTNVNAALHDPLSYAEVYSFIDMMKAKDNCTTNLVTIGRNVEYFIQKTEFPNGRVTYSIQELSSTPKTGEITTCTSRPLH